MKFRKLIFLLVPSFFLISCDDIVEINDVDVNIGEGSFDYDINEREKYTQKLIQLFNADCKTNNDVEILSFSKGSGFWKIELPLKVGKGKYQVK